MNTCVCFIMSAHMSLLNMVRAHYGSSNPGSKLKSRITCSAIPAPFISATQKRLSQVSNMSLPPSCVWQGGFLGVEKPNAIHESLIHECMRIHTYTHARIHKDLEIWTLVIKITKRRNYKEMSNYI